MQIAIGVQGKVYKTTKNYAVKVDKNDDNEGEPIDFLREISILRRLKHPNILKLLAISQVNSKRAVYMYMATGTLHEYICALHRDETVSVQPEWYLYQLLRAVDYCHRHCVIHRDVKPQNVLLFDAKLQLADFGLGKICVATGDTHTSEVVTLWWRAPEILLGKRQYSYAVDVWSVGVIALTIFLRSSILQGYSERGQLNKIFKLLGTPTIETCPSVVKLPGWNNFFTAYPRKELSLLPEQADLIYKLLAWDPDRITAGEAMEHSYFNGVRPRVESQYKVKHADLDLYILPKKTSFDSAARGLILSSLWEVKNQLKLCYNTLFLAFNLFDRFLEENFDKEDLVGYSLAALFIASKLVDPLIVILSCLCDDYTEERLIEMEVEILLDLDYLILSDPRMGKLDEKNMIYITALYLNYDWATEWSPQYFVTLSGKKPSRKIRNHLRSLDGALANALRFRSR